MKKITIIVLLKDHSFAGSWARRNLAISGGHDFKERKDLCHPDESRFYL